jgi:hypothetical protein
MGIPSRAETSATLGRRVSKGEYERIFSRLIPVQLPTTKIGRNANGDKVMYHPIVAGRVPESPKAQRKKASRGG